ncbi:MAG: methyltransferase domain-containing protein [Rhodoluna sp.]
MSGSEQDRVQAIYDEFAKSYDDHYASAEFQEEDLALFKILSPWIRGKVLDLGCGTGLTLTYNDINKDDYLGIDPSAGMLTKLQAKFPGFVTVNSTFEHWNEADQGSKFDSILGLFGAPAYFAKESYSEVLERLTPKGHYFLMFYKPGYFPAHIYSEEDIAAAKARIDYDLINSTFETTFIFTNYLVATNIPKEFLPAR